MNDLEVAIALVETGAGIVRQRFGTTLEHLDKGGGDFATNADIESEQAMLAILRRDRPDDAFVAEESGRSGARSGTRTWFIDPLCGTLNYAVRMRVAAVNAALLAGDRPLAAAVADPFNDEMFWTDGVSACQRSHGQDQRLVPDGRSQLVDLNLDPPFPSAPVFTTVKLAADPAFAARFRPRVLSTSIALTWVATGQRAAYVTDGDVLKSVHFAAGLAICGSAGCLLTDLRGNALRQGAPGLVAAADPDTHSAIMALVRRHFV